MRRPLLLLSLLALFACEKGTEINREPLSVRGWILDVKGAKHGETIEMEIARRTELFANAAVWVENYEYASGGIAENGAFVVLDVPPNSILGFNAPGAETAKLPLEGVPGTADVIIPDVILQPNGATVLDPSKIVIRLPDNSVDAPKPTGKTAKVAGYTVPIIATPYSQLGDRREYPDPGGFRPVATVK